ncbi:MAG: hypothetical protein PHW02_05720 [bacterium]|nr:hypothetical protein [bacterium]
MKNFSIAVLFFACILLSANEKALIESLSYMSSDAKELSVDLRCFMRDSFSMKFCDYILSYPEKSEYETEKLIEKARKLNFASLYAYAESRENLNKKSFKFDYKLVTAEKNPGRIDFLADTSVADSAYYMKALEFLSGINNEKEKKKRRILMLESVDFLLLMEDSEVLEFAKKLKSNNDAESKIIIGGFGPDTHHLTQENVLIVEPGGDDVYLCGEGYSIACGVDGISGIIDIAGDDFYQGKGFDLGCGINGAGFIDDRMGNDRYSSSFCALGAGFDGIGFILDRKGNDEYISSGLSQGFGFTKGLGLIFDMDGNDSYLAVGGINDHREEGYHSHMSQGFGFGVRDIASGGVGLILDERGDDLYSGEYFVQGSSYWRSAGILYDGEGNDIYKSRRYSQGAGTHFTVGLLFDREGNDLYHSWGVSQGCGHDFSFGMLSDYAGDDLYFSTWLSQGAGNANGAGVLLDFNGDDSYKALKTDCQGWANPDRKTYSYGILFDMKGRDSFSSSFQKTEVKCRMGVLIDKD